MNTFLAKWNDEQCPLLNGISYACGKYYPINQATSPRRNLPINLEYGLPQELPDATALQWAFINPLCEATNKRDGFLVKAGEASMGGDGFVALLNQGGLLLWVAFFDFSNPFIQVRFDDEYIVAENNLQEQWRISISRPWMIIIQRP